MDDIEYYVHIKTKEILALPKSVAEEARSRAELCLHPSSGSDGSNYWAINPILTYSTINGHAIESKTLNTVMFIKDYIKLPKSELNKILYE